MPTTESPPTAAAPVTAAVSTQPRHATVCLAPHRSLLHLGPGARQLGLNPATALATDELPFPLVRMLDELTQPVDRAELLARAVHRGADAAAAEGLLHQLLEAGAVVDATGSQRRVRHRATSTVIVVGDGPLAVGLATGLALGGVGAVHADVTGTVVAADLGTGYLDADRGHDRARAVAAAVHRLVPSARIQSPPPRLRPDLVILADAVAPDPARVTRLLADGTAHLLVRLRDGTGVVGPLVLPGRSACLGCLELHRCARDPGWPTVAAQLVDRPGRAESSCTAATVAFATAQSLVALDGGTAGGPVPAVLDATLELDPAAATLFRRPWVPHPDCGCGAAAVPMRAPLPFAAARGDSVCAGTPAGGTIEG